jgi:hypothetical protein
MEHTEAMLSAWGDLEVSRADLAIRRQDGAMLWQRDRPLENLPLAWARAENAHGSDIYVRPARGHAWPLVFLDDVALDLALEVAGTSGGLAVQTSPEGGCHLWLPTGAPLDEEGRCHRQRWLAQQLGADLASTSGEHLGRLAGFRNWKRGGCWVNLLAGADAGRGLRRVAAPEPPSAAVTVPGPRVARDATPAQGRDLSASGQEWGWACRMLESGWDPERVYEALLGKAACRRGPDADRYARRTVERATEKVRQRLR